MGGLFERSQLLRRHEYMVMFDALQKAFEKQNPHIMKSALQTTARALGHQLEDRVRCTSYAILDSLSLSNFDY